MVDTAGFNASTDDMARLGNRFSDTHAHIVAIASKLDDKMIPALSQRGQFANALNNVFERYKRDTKKLLDELEANAESLGAAAKDYQAQEEVALAELGKIGEKLGG